VIELRVTLPEDAVEEIARRAAEIVLARLAKERLSGGDSPYLTVAEAAEYLRASRQRVYDLLSAGRLSRRKDGARVLVSRSELDAYLAGQNGRRGRQ
jgi:excisionase family DNA binding protein